MSTPTVARKRKQPREKLIHATKASKPARRRVERKVRYMSPDGPVEFASVGGSWFVSINGSPRRQYLNAEPPEDGAYSPACAVCNYGYSELSRTDSCGCSECRNEASFAMAYRLESAGIPLGWGYCGRDDNTVRPEYRHEQAVLMAWRENRASEIDRRFGARRLRGPGTGAK